MTDYINRDAVDIRFFIKRDEWRKHWIEYLEKRISTADYSTAEQAVDNWFRGCEEAMDDFLAISDSLQTADVEEVRHGYWQPNYETFIDYSERETEPIQTGWVCSLCGRYEPREEAYCHCGANMDGKGDEE